jgi:hypothetical protein
MCHSDPQAERLRETRSLSHSYVYAKREQHDTGARLAFPSARLDTAISKMRPLKLSPKTQTGYIRAVKRFAGCLGRAPDSANAEDLRRFQLHLVEQGMSTGSLNATITGLKFFFENALERP